MENEIKFIMENKGTEVAENITVNFYLIGDWYYDENNRWTENLTLLDQKEFEELGVDEKVEMIFTYITGEELAGELVRLLFNITASNDVYLQNNDLYLYREVAPLLEPDRPQSKIVNNEDFDIVGDLIMILQKKVGTSWIDQQVVVDKEITIPVNDLIKLDYEWNPQDVSVKKSSGIYRVYASFESGGSKIENSWEFEVSGFPVYKGTDY